MRLARTLVVVALAVASAVLFGAYRDARASSSHHADTITTLSVQLSSLRLQVGQLQTRLNTDELLLAGVKRRTDELCFHSHVVTDVSVDYTGHLLTSLAYC